MDLENVKIRKLEEVLLKVAGIETVILAIVGLIALTMYITDLISPMENESLLITIPARMTILGGILSGIHHCRNADRNFRKHGWVILCVVTLLFISFLLSGLMLTLSVVIKSVMVTQSRGSIGDLIVLLIFCLLIPIKSYCHAIVWKLYKLDKAGGVENRVA